MRGPASKYHALINKGAIDADPAQAEAAARLEELFHQLKGYRGAKGGLFSKAQTPPQGVYLWGGVGRGKSFLMDLFFDAAPTMRKRRLHFHEFMIDAHERINHWRAAPLGARKRHPAYNRKAPDDPIPYAAFDIAKESLLLCFDEFQVSDIADAMVLGRLFEHLFAHRVVVVATSNRHPDTLYEHGLNRQLFLPFIGLLKEKLDILELQSACDYRLQRLSAAPVYYTPLGAEAERNMDAAWARVVAGTEVKRETLPVKGRKLVIPHATPTAARVSFEQLCARPLGAHDYLALVRRFSIIFMDAIPQMDVAMRNEAKRFVTLIDAVYDSRTKFVCSADCEPEALYPAGDGAFEFERTASRLIEMRSDDYLGAEHILSDNDEPSST